MNYLIARENIEIKGYWIPKGSKYTLDSEGYLHSFNDLPAIIKPDGSQAWFLNGKYHRVNGPAFIDSNRYQSWYLNGKLHREDGPAIIHPDGIQEWYLNGYRVHPIEVFSLLKAKGVDLTHFALDKNKKVREAVKQLLY